MGRAPTYDITGSTERERDPAHHSVARRPCARDRLLTTPDPLRACEVDAGSRRPTCAGGWRSGELGSVPVTPCPMVSISGGGVPWAAGDGRQLQEVME